ncbi:hypothetical protein [Tsukamurella sp. 1534]|uniref:hypothetical protein n=1 Tax=Tsukamurella sp. 1534 TaxID=1151061 RepID=UPI00031FE4A0|nr:hypothetical protein [Tsukamurella sp. 1534]
MNANDLHSLSHTSSETPRRTESRGGAHDLLMDSMRLGPAPTRAREGAVIVTSVLFLAAVIAILQPPVIAAAIVSGVVALHLAVRWVLGTRKWGAA